MKNELSVSSSMHNGASLSPVALVTKVRLRAGVDAGFSLWHAKMCNAVALTPGLVSAEVTAPVSSAHPEWSVVQYFRSTDELNIWRGSQQHRSLLDEAASLADVTDGLAAPEEEVVRGAGYGPVTEVITTYVKPGKDREYHAWAEKIHRIEAQYPGYRGIFLQPPISTKQGYWTTLVRFATPEQLDAWLNSPERRDLLREHSELVKSWEHHRLPSSFAGWFPSDSVSAESPSSWKQSMLIIAMLFPIVMLEVRFLNPLLHGLNTSAATFIGNVLSVFLLSWPAMPIIIALMNWWLSSQKHGPKWINPVGIALLITLYAIEVLLFSLAI
jgi:uncharacterized protein